MLKLLLFVTTFLSTCLSAPAPKPFVVLASHSGSPIHLGKIEASGQKFWIGKGPSTYCPSPPVTNCPPGTDTAFFVNSGQATLVIPPSPSKLSPIDDPSNC